MPKHTARMTLLVFDFNIHHYYAADLCYFLVFADWSEFQARDHRHRV